MLALVLVSAAQGALGQSTGLILTPADKLRGIPLASTPFSGTELPPAVDLSSQLPPPGNQGTQQSCVGWAVAYGLKSYQEQGEEAVAARRPGRRSRSLARVQPLVHLQPAEPGPRRRMLPARRAEPAARAGGRHPRRHALRCRRPPTTARRAREHRREALPNRLLAPGEHRRPAGGESAAERRLSRRDRSRGGPGIREGRRRHGLEGAHGQQQGRPRHAARRVRRPQARVQAPELLGQHLGRPGIRMDRLRPLRQGRAGGLRRQGRDQRTRPGNRRSHPSRDPAGSRGLSSRRSSSPTSSTT